MTTRMRRAGLAVVALVAMAAFAVLFASFGCSDTEEETTTTVAASEGTTNGSINVDEQRVVVGGKTKEEYEASLPDLEAAVKAAPNDLDALQNLAVAQYNTGRYEAAAATYQTMLSITDTAVLHNNYANTLRDWGKVEEAAAQYQQAIAADPTLAVAYVNLAVMISQQGDGQGAVDLLNIGLGKVSEADKESLQTYLDKLTAVATTTTT